MGERREEGGRGKRERERGRAREREGGREGVYLASKPAEMRMS